MVRLNVKSYWDGLSKVGRLRILRQKHFWDGLSDFKYELLPEDVIKHLSRQIEGKRP